MENTRSTENRASCSGFGPFRAEAKAGNGNVSCGRVFMNVPTFEVLEHPESPRQGQSDMPSRILLVDDQNSVRDALYTILESDGYEVLAASNGRDGLTIFRQSTRPIELLVTDYNMPQMSGLELARECSRLCGELSVLYVSGSHPDE